jgi:hypothetical protein
MSTWPKDELRKIAETDDLHISPLRDDGKTYGTPTWIGPLWLMTRCMCAPTTEKTPVGIRPPFSRKPGGSLLPESPKKLVSNRWATQSITVLMMRIAESTRAART